MSRVSVGTAWERKARLILEEQGWLVERKNRTRFTSPDFYELFDLIAIKDDKLRLIQVKYEQKPSHYYTARKEIQQWLKKTGIKHDCEVWLKVPRKPWKTTLITLDKYIDFDIQ